MQASASEAPAKEEEKQVSEERRGQHRRYPVASSRPISVLSQNGHAEEPAAEEEKPKKDKKKKRVEVEEGEKEGQGQEEAAPKKKKQKKQADQDEEHAAEANGHVRHEYSFYMMDRGCMATETRSVGVCCTRRRQTGERPSRRS